MSRRIIVLLPLLLVISSCSSKLGRSMPECEGDPSATVIMQIQSVPRTSYVPCVHALDAGWEFNDVVPRSGLAEFSIDSDRIGDPFITVRTTATCDIGDAEQKTSDERGILLYRDVVEDFKEPVVIIPEGPNDATLAAARAIIVETFGLRMRDRAVDAHVDVAETPTQDRIEVAHADGAHVITISIRDAEEGTVSLLLAGEIQEQTGLRIDDAFEEIEERVTPPSYRGSWFYVFEGGCTEYRFDAEGPGVEKIAAEVQSSLSFIDADAIKDAARSAGYDIP
jgi:hypothetical protein